MLMPKMIEKIDRVPDIFRQYACIFNYHKFPGLCRSNDPVKKYICYKM